MAITPGEAAKINDANERKAVKEMEGYIDGMLNKQFRTGTSVRVGRVGIQRAGADGFSSRAEEEVLSRFRLAGWLIKKKKKTERFGPPDIDYEFSVVPPISNGSDPRAQGSWFEADNQGLPPYAQR